MKTNYIAPLTEIVLLSAQHILEKNQDSTGILSGNSEDLGANDVAFETEVIEVPKNLWDD